MFLEIVHYKMHQILTSLGASTLFHTRVDEMLTSVGRGLQYAEVEAFKKDNHYTLFRVEDTKYWIIFSIVFAVLIFFDNFVLHRGNTALTPFKATVYTLFWIFMACVFCGWVWYVKGLNNAFNWMTGYLLEWMLSFDNLFVFHLIFQSYATPDFLKHKPLFWGICGAVFFRLIFLFIGEYMMHAMFLCHILFGGFLVYTGVKTGLFEDDDDEDPSKNPVVQWLSRRMPFVGAYDSQGRFFARVPVDENGQVVLPEGVVANLESPSNDEDGDEEPRNYGTVDMSEAARACSVPHRLQWRATMLFLVVVCLEVSDILFAVDSVSAIVAQVPDLFLAYTSAVFAMLGLRATFFIVDELVKLFSLLKYGVAAVLVFIGLKLMASRLIHVPAGVVFALLFTTLGGSMVASVIHDKFFIKPAEAREASEAAALVTAEGKK
jgi:tellurite resistance protein TerC